MATEAPSHFHKATSPERQNADLIAELERQVEAVRAGKSKTVPLEDVMKQYGLAG